MILLLALLVAQAGAAGPIKVAPHGLADSQQGTFLQNGTGATLRSIESKLRDTVSVKDFGAVCDGSTDDRAAFQAAITATPAGGMLLIPSGATNCVVCAGLPLTITKSIFIQGQGGTSTQANSGLQVCSSLGATTDIILVQPPAGQVISVKFADFTLFPTSGTPGRYGIKYDGAVGEINQTIIDHMSIGQFGSAAIRAEGPGLVNGTPAATVITRSYLIGGVSILTAGDSVKFRDNTFPGSGTIDVGFVQGASLMEFQGNYILSDGGIHIGAAGTAVMFWGNEIQTQGTFTGSNGAVLDIDGTVGNHAVDSFIGMNSFQVVSGITANEIRVNFADRTQILSNRFGRGITTSKDVVITANATDTYVGPNAWVSGGPFTSMVSDSGTNTTFAGPYPASGVFSVANNKYFGTLDDAGNSRRLIGTDNTGVTNIYGYRGQPMMSGNNGQLLLFDSGAGANIGGVIGTATSSLPVAGTITSVANIFLKPFTFATLPTPSNFMVVGCSDCTIANPCAGGGTGAIAKRLNGVWVCN